MTDRNTISQVIESLFEDWIDRNVNVHPLAVENMRILEADALALLKEQEAVEPVAQSSVYDPDTWFFVCGSCKKSVIDRGDKFCRWCGQAVKWDD